MTTRRGPLAMLADSGPVLVLAGIAAAGSFTHIRETARTHGQHGWMAWAIAICIDLTCVMAARERHRDKNTGRVRGLLSWPTLVLVGGILLSLAANLAQAERSAWGWVVAGTPAAAFLVAVSMLERRASTRPRADEWAMTAPPSFGAVPDRPDLPSPDVSATSLGALAPSPDVPAPSHTPELVPARSRGPDEPDSSSATDPPLTNGPLLDFARRVATEHETNHGRPITRDALRARLGVSNQLASELLRQIRNQPAA